MYSLAQKWHDFGDNADVLAIVNDAGVANVLAAG